LIFNQRVGSYRWLRVSGVPPRSPAFEVKHVIETAERESARPLGGQANGNHRERPDQFGEAEDP
jgi:hypothetical protein